MSRVGVWGVSKPEGLGKCCYILRNPSRAWSRGGGEKREEGI